jgi:hypothetical protein
MPPRFARRVVPQRAPSHDMSLAATFVLFGLAPLMIAAAFTVIDVLNLFFH